MISAINQYLEHLRAEVQALGHHGGSMSPSVYDTAQVLRHAPPEDARPAIDWLLYQQQLDGGWGPPGELLNRYVPTLAAALALHEHASTASRPEARRAIIRALEFLCHNAHVWAFEGGLPDDIPVAAELVLPRLLDEARAVGWELPSEPFNALRALGHKRLGIIAKVNPPAGTAPMHAWETWKGQPELRLVDGSRGVGHSPAATAVWLAHRRKHAPAGSEELLAAERFLREASAATRTGIPGVVPTVWPIDRFEQVWGLFALHIMGLLDHPLLRDSVSAQLDDLYQSMRPEGHGMSDHFICDADLTATSLVLLAGAGYPVGAERLAHYQLKDGQFITYSYELQPSVTTTAHGVMALAVLGRETTQPAHWLLERQQPDGRWTVDKWHTSWLYTTSQSMLALTAAGRADALRAGVNALLAAQHRDGGWGAGRASTCSETAYAVQALYGLRFLPAFAQPVQAALHRARHWMSAQEDSRQEKARTYWIGKELYHPYRLDRVFELSALVALQLDESTALEAAA